VTIAPTQRPGDLSDRLNPMVVRELRQLINSRAIPGLFLLLLLVMVVVLAHSSAKARVASDMAAIGYELAQRILYVLATGFVIVMPLIAAVRLHRERHSRQLELIVATGMRFRRIFFGKLWSAVLIELMALSATLPFAITASYLRGVDIPSILSAAVWILFISMIALAMALGMACHTMGLVSIWFVAALTLVFVMICWIVAWTGALDMLHRGWASIFDAMTAGVCACSGLTLAVVFPMVLAGAADKVNRNRTTTHTAPYEWNPFATHPPGEGPRRPS